jgi:vacuolar-type H+-ATPase subunit H
MSQHDIELIKETEANLLESLKGARIKAEQFLQEAENQGQNLLLERQQEAHDYIKEKRASAMRSALLESQEIRRDGEKRAEEIRERSAGRISLAVTHILSIITGGAYVSPRTDE